MKIIALGASTSSKSINQQFATFAAQQIDPVAEVLHLQDYVLPLYSTDLQENHGIPPSAMDFLARLDTADLVIISFAEHNGSYTAAFKNLLDWASRCREKTFLGTKMLLLATSPGARGGATVLNAAAITFPYMGAKVISCFSLPSYYQNFIPDQGIIQPELQLQFQSIINAVKTQFTQEPHQ
jgi:NAD(P)H-dependent FMN reductase